MLSHVDAHNRPSMVDVGDKKVTMREAVAESHVWLPGELRRLLIDGEMESKKGPVLATAIIAGTMAAKKTHELIPFCHPLPIEGIKIEIAPESEGLRIQCRVKATHKTGVEMEALTGASVAALTVYDMCKAVSQDMRVTTTQLVSKTGGKNDFERLT